METTNVPEYKILDAFSAYDLSQEVTRYIKQGWTLRGELSLFRTGEFDISFTQVVIKNITTVN